MATKSPKSTPTSPAKPLKKAALKRSEKVKPRAVARKKRTAGKSSTKLAPSFTLDPKPPAQEPVISHDEISLRAYFIAERRHKMGCAGDSATYWEDAVSQLSAEALEKPLRKR